MPRTAPSTLAGLACLLLLSQAAPARAAAPPTPHCVACDKTNVRVERFFPEEKERRPAVVLLHGIRGTRDSIALYRSIAARFAARGYVVAIVHFFDRTATKQKELPGL